MKVNKKSFLFFLDNIVLNAFVDEYDVYDIFKHDNIDSLYKGEDIIKQENNVRGFNQMGSGAVEVLQSLSLIAGTFSAILHIISYFQKENSKKYSKHIIQGYWSSQLIASGLPIQVANKISNQYKSQLIELLLQESRELRKEENKEESTEENRQTIQKLKLIKTNIANNNIRESIFNLFNYIDESNINSHNRLIIISANFEKNQRIEKLGIASNEEISMNYNKLINSLLELIDELIIWRS